MKQLLQLDLINNPVAKLPGYREKVFKIFPTITILDTLDKGGKDAYTSSSMALSVSRVPDALFDKSAPVPAPYFAPPVPAPVPARVVKTPRTSSISKPVTSTTTTPATIIPAPVTSVSTSRMKAISSNSSKPKAVSSSSKLSGKTGKVGKVGKIAVATKSRSASSRAGLVFPVGRLKRKIK